MKLVEYSDKSLLMQGAAEAVTADLKAALNANSSASLAVPGGSTPGPMFDILSKADLNWPAVAVMLTDERWVDLASPRSNTVLIKSRLLTNVAATAYYVPLYNGADTAVAGVADISVNVDRSLPLDVLVLGMGADMHTASLFPDAPELAAAQADDAGAIVSMTPGDGLEDRVTLSAQALAKAGKTHVLIVGPDKKAALEQALTLPADQAPIAQFLPNATVHWAPE